MESFMDSEIDLQIIQYHSFIVHSIENNKYFRGKTSSILDHPWPLLLTWFNFNLCMDK